MEDKILLEMQQQLGRIEATITAVKDDITELKQKDISQAENLEKAYSKAKARQDSIRDDLQHQIDNNKTLILTVNESINTLNKNIDKMVKELSDNISKKLDSFDVRLTNLETRKEKALVKWYDKIVDKLAWALIVSGGVVLLKWLNVPVGIIEKVTQ